MEADYLSYTTLPRRSSRHVPTPEESREMELERTLASLNISQTGPVPPPRLKRMSKKLNPLPSKLPVSSVDSGPWDSKLKAAHPHKQTCDIIESSQWRNDLLSEPDLLSHSNTPTMDKSPKSKTSIHKGAINRKGCSSSSSTSSHDSRSTSFSISRTQDKEAKKLITEKQAADHNKKDVNVSKTRIGSINKPSSNNKATSSSSKPSSLPRFSFYRPKSSKDNKTSTTTDQSPMSKSLTERKKVISIGQKLSSPDGSFVNPAFIVSNPSSSSHQPMRADTILGDVPLHSRRIQSAKPLTVDTSRKTPLSIDGKIPKIPHSPPSMRFNRQFKQPKLDSMKSSPHTNNTLVPLKALPPIKAVGQQPKKAGHTVHPTNSTISQPLATHAVEKGLRQYQTTKLDPGDMCSQTDLDAMMKYYSLSSSDKLIRETTPPPGKLNSCHKLGSPFSSTSSLNVGGETLDIIHRRKKKVKIRPSSFSSDDETVKRISLEINLSQPVKTPEPANKFVTRNLSMKTLKSGASVDTGATNGMAEAGKFSGSNVSLNGTVVEKLELDDLTSTETAKLLKKQFSKLKMRASSLKVKDTELKQKFLILQNKRGRLSSSSGGITKARSRTSLV